MPREDLKQASPKAANIHNRWWRERSERNLRFHRMQVVRPRARLCRLPEQEEGEHMEYLHRLLVFALFEDVMLSCCETAGYVRFALFTSGYGYSPPSATLA